MREVTKIIQIVAGKKKNKLKALSIEGLTLPLPKKSPRGKTINYLIIKVLRPDR